ncbi:MAG: PA4780 family RIO1-like protein kinase [Candidatus Binatia bacterium]
MRVPESLAALSAEGIIEEVMRPLRSGKEAQIYLVLSGGEQRVAKIYKDAENRTFKQRSGYIEGRRVRNSRDQRAMGKHTSYGRAKDEDAWRSAEVEAIYRLRDAGVRVPEPFHFVDGVLIMELVTDAAGNPAPRLGEVAMTAAEARAVFDRLLRDVVRMLAAGLVHGDLSDFNVLMGADGPVLIDFPQSVDASRNQNARELLIRDVDNLTDFLGRFEPAATGVPYGQEMWSLYERGELTPDSVLTGEWQPPEALADTTAILRQIEEAELDEQRRRIARGLPPITPPKPEPSPPQQNAPKTPTQTPPAPRKKRRRRRRRGSAGAGPAQAARPSS